MNEQSMKCKDCVLKHIANAMSYAKEILAGHGIGGTPDHRPDYLGELVNAENHLEHISIELLNRVMVIRTAAQMRRMVPSETEIDELRKIWIDVEGTEVPEGSVGIGTLVSDVKESTEVKEPLPDKHDPVESLKFDNFPGLDEMDKVGVLLDDVWYLPENEEKFNVFMKLLKKNFSNCEVVLKQQFSKSSEEPYTGKYVWVFPLNVFVSRPVNAKFPVTSSISFGKKASFIMRIVSTESFKENFQKSGESLTACEVVDTLDLSPYPITTEDQIVLGVYRKPCCSVKSRLSSAKFVRVNDDGWPYMKEFWEFV